MAPSSTATADSLLVCVTAPLESVARLRTALTGTGRIVAGRHDGARACLVVETADQCSLRQVRRVLRGLSCRRDLRFPRVEATRLACATDTPTPAGARQAR